MATTLDVVHLPETRDEKAKLAAYLKLSFGGFHSHEYLTHVFLVPEYDWFSGELNLDVGTGLSGDVSARARISEDGRKIFGTVQSTRGGIQNAPLELHYLSPVFLEDNSAAGERVYRSKLDTIFSDVPVFPPLTGSYSSNHKMLERIQLELSKRAGLSGGSSVPMEGYEARGRVVGANPYLKGEPPTVVRAINSFADFTYNFYLAELEFAKIPSLGKCRRTPSGISCANATFYSVVEEKALLTTLASEQCTSRIRPFRLSESDASAPITAETRTELVDQLQYEGYLHLEERNVQRPFMLGIHVAGSAVQEGATLRNREVTLLPRVYEGKLPSDAGAHFQPISLQPVSISDFVTETFVLTGKGGDRFEIVKWTHHEIAGVYYSGVFGRVGTFLVTRKRSESEVATVPSVPYAVLGDLEPTSDDKREWAQHQLELQWATDPNALLGPHSLGGTFSIIGNRLDSVAQRNVISSFPLENVRYDPFTGVMGADMSYLPDLSSFSLLAKIEPESVQLTFNNNTLTTEPRDRYHRVRVLSTKQKYGEITLPETEDLAPGRVHVFLPFDATLVINGKLMSQEEGSNHREFFIPRQSADGKPVTHEFVLRPLVGKEIKRRLTLNPKTYFDRPIIVNFYQLQ